MLVTLWWGQEPPPKNLPIQKFLTDSFHVPVPEYLEAFQNGAVGRKCYHRLPNHY